MDFNFTVREDKITACKEYVFTEGNKGYYRAVFDFGDDPVWEDGAKFCILENNDKVYKIRITGGWCYLPELARGSVKIGAFCVETLDGADMTTRISTNMRSIGVQDGAAGAEVNSEFSTAAEVWEQYLADMEKSRAAAEEASEKAAQSEANARVSADDALLSKEFAKGYAEGAQKCEEEACDSAKEAEKFAKAAEASAESIKNMSVSAVSGDEADVLKTETDDGIGLKFVLPRGEKGDKGDKGDRGDSYILTEVDKHEIANEVSVKTQTEIEYLKNRSNEHDERLDSQSNDIEALAQGIEAPKNVIYLENDLRIEAREDGIYLCGSDAEYGIEDETLLYSPVNGVQAAEAGHANIADEAFTAIDANYSYCAEVDAEERILKGTLVDEFGDVENAVPAIADGYIRAYGIVSTSLIATLEEDYQRLDFESALYFATPSEIPENYTQFPADIYFKGDSTDEGAFVPEANMRYTIVFDFDGYMMNGYVSGVTTV